MILAGTKALEPASLIICHDNTVAKSQEHIEYPLCYSPADLIAGVGPLFCQQPLDTFFSLKEKKRFANINKSVLTQASVSICFEYKNKASIKKGVSDCSMVFLLLHPFTTLKADNILNIELAILNQSKHGTQSMFPG